MTHRGITLIELLIAIAILLAIGAIVTPIMVHTLDERRFESAAEQVELHLLLARSYAQRTGQSVEVRYDPNSHRLIARRFMREVDEHGGVSSRRAPAARRPARDLANGESFGAFDDDDAAESAITEAWAERALPRGVDLSDRRPEQSMTIDMPGRVNQQMSTSMMDAQDVAMREMMMVDGEPIRLAVFLPDGSAMLARTMWLTDDRDRIGRIRISAWTGIAKYERLPGLTDDAPLVEDDTDDDAM